MSYKAGSCRGTVYMSIKSCSPTGLGAIVYTWWSLDGPTRHTRIEQPFSITNALLDCRSHIDSVAVEENVIWAACL